MGTRFAASGVRSNRHTQEFIMPKEELNEEEKQMMKDALMSLGKEVIGDKKFEDIENPKEAAATLANSALEYLLAKDKGSSKIHQDDYLFFVKCTIGEVNGFNANAQVYWTPGWLDLSVEPSNDNKCYVIMTCFCAPK